MTKLTRTQLLPMAGICALGLFSPRAHADFFIHSWENHHTEAKLFDVGADMLWYRTSSNYDSTGTSFTPFGLNSYQRVLLDFTGAYGLTSKLSAYGRLDWEVSKVDSTNPAAFTGTSYGLGDQTLGLNYRIYEMAHGAAIDLQGQVDFPFYSNKTSTDVANSPTLGDASVDLTAGAFVTVPLSEKAERDIRLVGGAGYTYRTNSFSSAVPWSVSAQLLPRKEGLVVNGGAFGVQSLSTDSHPNNTILLNTSAGSVGTGGSYISNAINSSHLTVRGEAGYRTQNDLQFTGSVAQTVWGHSAPSGLTLALGLQTHFGGQETGPKDPTFQSTAKYGHSNKGYVNYNLEAKVLRANDRFNLVKIDKGLDHGVRPGDVFDIFMTNPDGSIGSAIARGRVTSAKGAEAAIKVDEYFNEVWIEEGFIARRPIN